MEKLFERLLVVGAHMDDPEFLAGGTMAKFSTHTKAVVFSSSRGVAAASMLEMAESMKILGVEDYELCNDLMACQDGAMSFHYQRGLMARSLDRIRNDYRPTLVITHQRGDTHQDHAAVRDEVVRCFKNYCSIFYGYQPWNNLEGFLRGSAYVKLSTRLVALKLDALEAYTSQHLELRGYFDRSWQESQLMLFGGLVGSTYAEAFGVARLVYE